MMCDIAPFQMECICDPHKHKLACCQGSHMAHAWQELKMSLPIIGKFFEPHRCPFFMPKLDGGDNNGC